MRSKEEVENAIRIINANKELSYAYREDVSCVLNWVLGGMSFDGLPDAPKDITGFFEAKKNKNEQKVIKEQ